jgi:hypothetical protein
LSKVADKFGNSVGVLRNTDIITKSTHVLALPTKKALELMIVLTKLIKF